MSDKNRKLIFVAVIAVICALYFLMPYRMLNNIQKRNKQEVESIRSQITVLREDVNKKEKYIEEIELFKEEIELINSRFPEKNSQERVIYTMNDMEKRLELEFPNVVYGQDVVVKTSNEDAFKLEEKYYEELLAAQKEGREGEIQKPEIPLYDMFVKTSVATETYLDYEEIKGLLNYLYPEVDDDGYIKVPNENRALNKRVVIESISIERNEDVDQDKDFVVGFTLNFYALTNAEREPDSIFLGDYKEGKPNGIFEIYESLDSETDLDGQANVVAKNNMGKKMEANNDFFILLSPITSDETTIVAGATNDTTAKTYVYDDRNSSSNVEFRFYMYNGSYYYRYRAGDDSYPTNYNSGIKFIPGEYIEIEVFGKERTGVSDKSGANVTIINETDTDVNVYYRSEDFERPRFNVINKKGNVTTP